MPKVRFFKTNRPVAFLTSWEPDLGSLRQQTRSGQTVFTHVLFFAREGLLGIQNMPLGGAFLKSCFTWWDGMGWDGMRWDKTEYQMGPSIFFMLCSYIDKIYVYTNTCIKRFHQHPYGFQELMRSRGTELWFLNLQFSH